MKHPVDIGVPLWWLITIYIIALIFSLGVSAGMLIGACYIIKWIFHI